MLFDVNLFSEHPPVCYQIYLKGKMSKVWDPWFPGFEVKHMKNETVITGPVKNSNGLEELIRMIRNLGLRPVSITIAYSEKVAFPVLPPPML